VSSGVLRSRWLPVSFALLSVASLLCPWAASGLVERSSLELLRSATALDVLSDGANALLLTSWFSVFALAAAMVLAAAWHRPRLMAWCGVPIGPMMVTAGTVILVSPFSTVWGAPMGMASGVATAVSCGAMLMASSPDPTAEGVDEDHPEKTTEATD